MKIDFTKPILNLDGTPVKLSERDTLTLKAVSTGALLSAHPSDENLPGEDKAKRFALAMTIEQADGAIDLKPEDVVTLRSLIGRGYAPLVVGRAYELLG